MPTICSGALKLQVSDDGADVTLVNRATESHWTLDGDSCLADGSGRDRVPFGRSRESTGENCVDQSVRPALPFSSGRVERLSDQALLVSHRGPAGELVLRYELTGETCRVTVLAGRSTVTTTTLPGAFRPTGVKAPAVVLPKNQGVWHRGTGKPFSLHLARNGHSGWSMPFFAVVGEREALLTIIETEHDGRIWFEKTDDGLIRIASLQDPTRGALTYDRSVLLRFVAPEVNSIAKAYRQYVQERGHFLSWEEKLEKRPHLDRLFGALMCFIGYCQDEGLDYAASFRALRAIGFERSFVYPLAIGNPAQDFLMGGRPPIDIRHHLRLLEELGYLAASWMWVEDIPQMPEDLVLGPGGEPRLSWQIDERKWYRCCPIHQVVLANQIQDERMSGHTAQHFDVTTSRLGLECYHPNHPLDRREDALWRRKVLETAIRRGCVVSSEGFWGYATPSYDVGSVKIPLPVHTDWYTVPLTSLVYHDSCVHDWWEVDNYNNPHHRNQFGRDRAYFALCGGGWQRLQATQDALMGAPPNVMPFGAQYAFVEGRGPKTCLYSYRLESPEVQEALRLALPLAHLHRRIGRLACVEHQTLAPDGSLQTTTFADGTHVVVNYASEPREVKDVGLLEPVSWKAVE